MSNIASKAGLNVAARGAGKRQVVLDSLSDKQEAFLRQHCIDGPHDYAGYACGPQTQAGTHGVHRVMLHAWLTGQLPMSAGAIESVFASPEWQGPRRGSVGPHLTTLIGKGVLITTGQGATFTPALDEAIAEAWAEHDATWSAEHVAE